MKVGTKTSDGGLVFYFESHLKMRGLPLLRSYQSFQFHQPRTLNKDHLSVLTGRAVAMY